ncbi:MAG: hypothetical protein QOJ44_1079, partial [Acidimicrobiaceae bacterium]|nr:hypothetical protein [Acidimicrobiaceae bacterium]
LPARWRDTPAIRLLQALTRPAGVAAAVVAPAVASYTAVLLSDTATPTWHGGRGEMPFVFVGSAAAAAGGLGMLGAPPSQAGPARRMAVAGALVDLAAAQRMEASMGLAAETLHQGRAGHLMGASKACTALGAAATALFGARSRAVSAVAGAALLAGSACTRFGIFEAGQASARDPKYTVVPQRRRLEHAGSGPG